MHLQPISEMKATRGESRRSRIGIIANPISTGSSKYSICAFAKLTQGNAALEHKVHGPKGSTSQTRKQQPSVNYVCWRCDNTTI